MAHDVQSALQPRKTPVQARSAVTVRAIFEATIQVLLSHGADRWTTTRVAERAGVSVGTLYQYYPNKRSLLFAVLEGHVGRVTAAVEAACDRARHKQLAEMVKEVVEAFVDAKMERTDISMALYQIALEVDGPVLVRRSGERLQKTLDEMLILDRFQDETKNDTMAVCQDHDTSIGNSFRKREPSLPKPPISDS